MKKSTVSIVATAAVFCLLGNMATVHAIIPSPLLSKGKTVKTSSGSGTSMLVDGKFGSGVFTTGNNSWIAINIGKGPSKIFFVWNNPNETWSDEIAKEKSCKKSLKCPVDYTVETSGDSKDGSDGQWKTGVTVKGNVVSTRGHEIDFTDAAWVKMKISNGAGQLDEIEVFDASNGLEDSWFFAGTSISQMTYKLSSNLINTYAKLINDKHSQFYPAMVRGGIPCILTKQFADDISKYLEAAGNCHYWAIEMGTNDAWGGTNSGVATFKANLQKVIDSCKARGIQPVIAKVLGTNPSAMTQQQWQVNSEYITAVEDLTKKNNLIEGPDLFNTFKNSSVLLGSDGVHPSDSGAKMIQKLWAEKMDALYTTVAAQRSRKNEQSAVSSNKIIQLYTQTETISASVSEPGILSLYNLNGRLISTLQCSINGVFKCTRPAGCVLAQYKTAYGIVWNQMIH